MSIPLGTVSLAGVNISGMATALTKKYQKKLAKVTKLVDIMTSALAVFERCAYLCADVRGYEVRYLYMGALSG